MAGLHAYTPNPARERQLFIVAAAWIALLAWSGSGPYDRLTWVLETAPVMAALPLLVTTHRRLPLTNLLYAAIFVHGSILMLGGAYSYARVPLGFEIAHWLGITRNPYDKIGHFAQGFVPALVAREIFIRGGYVAGARMRAFVVICVVLAISATYELIEWAAALALGQGADEFLGSQGDVWDTQSDMFFALIGAVAALLLLSGAHDRAIAAIERRARRHTESRS